MYNVWNSIIWGQWNCRKIAIKTILYTDALVMICHLQIAIRNCRRYYYHKTYTTICICG